MKENRHKMSNDSIITLNEIKMILENYHIGKKPLAKLLGWGETTIIRYMEGDIPTNEYSDKLKIIFENPSLYYDTLLKYKDNLTGVAFKKSKKAVLKKIMASKINVIAQYIVNKSNADICASYLQFILYYIQAFSLALKDKELFEEEYSVNYNSMPYLKLYENMKSYGINTLEMSEDDLTLEEKELIDKVYDSFSWYGSKALVAMTSYEKTFLKVSRDKENCKIITKDAIKMYFKEILMQYNIQNIGDITNYIDKKMMELRNIYN